MLKHSFLIYILAAITSIVSPIYAYDIENDSLKNNETDTISKKGAWGIGYGAGYGKGTGTKNIDSLIDALYDSTNTNKPKFTKGGALTGKRSRKNILKTVIQNLAALRYLYNKRLREKPGLKGRVTTKFKINHKGEVISCKVVSSTVKDRKFKKNLVKKILKWNFGEIQFPNDTTEVIYPFVFSQ